MTYRTAGLEEIIRNHVIPYGIPCREMAALRAEGIYTVPAGISQWKALTDFCETYGGFVPRFARNGDLLAVPEDGGALHIIGDDTPVLALTKRGDHYGVISEVLVMKQGIALSPRMRKGAKVYTYGVVEQEAQTPLPHFYADNIRVQQGKIYFDFHTPNGVIPDILLGVPMYVNIENAVAAMAVAWLNGVTDKELRRGMASFKGVKRRFNIHIQTPHWVYIDDYAHHPQEIATAIEAVRKIYSDYTLVGVFQPHLYTRTRDFADEFAATLSTLDEVVLLPIYPAREEPIPGVESEMLLDRISNPNKHLVPKEQLVEWVASRIKQSEQPIAVLTLGAGDIDRLVKDIKNLKNG